MVVRLFQPWVGGTERQAHKLAKELIARGEDVRVVTGRWFFGTPAREVIDTVPVVRHGTLWEFFGIKGLRKFGGYLYMLTLAWHLFRTRGDYDLIHVHGLNYHTAVAAIVGRRLGKPTLVKLANSGSASDIERTRSGRQLAGSRFLLPAALRCDRFVALSPVIAEELRQAGVDDERIVSIPNGVEVGDAPVSRDGDGKTLRLVFLGRLHRQKGADVLLSACRLLADRSPNGLSVRIVGDGPERSGLELMVTERRLEGVVELVGEVGDPIPELDAADVFVLPSRTEGMSNALLEAMARGKAVVATAVSGSSALVCHGETGLLVPPDDAEVLAEALDYLASHPEEGRRMGEAAAAAIRRDYAMPTVARRYQDLYRELLATSSTGLALASGGGR